MTWHRVFDEAELKQGEMRAVEAGGQKLLLARLDDGVYAVQARCTHVFANLARGKLVEGCQVQCPLHRARFDLRTGEVVQWANFPPGVQLLNVVRAEKALQTYAVRVREGKIEVEV
jgi:3-phenylpropionate/trans-cinnamate dioxygenase ferredoxin subunit